MASNPHENSDLKLPMPPPPLLTRSTNEYEPTTPSHSRFMSPPQTPQGSPSKHQQPPGAYDLPNVFDNAMKLFPANNDSPSKNTRSQLQPKSPTKSGNGLAEHDGFPDYALAGAAPGSPRRGGNEENTPPGSRPGLKTQTSYITAAQQGRQEAYKTKEEPRFNRGLSAEDLEKISKPSVKRLANVTQLCRC
jgi:cell cycle protein kinase DBF2